MRSCLGLVLLLLLIVAVIVSVIYHVNSNSEIQFTLNHQDDATFVTTKTPIAEAVKKPDVKESTLSTDEIPIAQPVEEVPLAIPVGGDEDVVPAAVPVTEGGSQ